MPNTKNCSNVATSYPSLFYINSRSVKNKTLYLNDYISTYNYDFAAFSETWFMASDDNNTYINSLVPNGYAIKHIDRDDGRRGGGIALIYKQCFNIKQVEIVKNTQFECIMCTFTLNTTCIKLTTYQ